MEVGAVSISRRKGGAFGEVFVGIWQESIPVAVKMLKENDKWKEFEKEANLLK